MGNVITKGCQNRLYTTCRYFASAFSKVTIDKAADERSMINDKTIRLMLENMESAAQEAVRSDPAFFEALQSLKAEIDRDPRVQAAVNNLRAAGSRVFSSLVPHIRIRLRTNGGLVSLPVKDQGIVVPSVELVQLTQELKSAASAVIMRGRYREELDHILNEAVGGSVRFEGMASEVEGAGYEVVICLDLSAYAQVRESSEPHCKTRQRASTEPLSKLLSAQDLKFLKALKIKAVES
ncbi:MAG TPA: hypothetical protein VJN64_17715 [Terriglobales bacterium]|nr:hypothetical protein [Terriglobales bacterium]